MAKPITDDDFALLRAWRDGDRGAGDALMKRHYARVHRLFELKVLFVADDLTQRTFLACVEALERFEGRSSFRTFLFGIAHRQYQQYQRKDGRREAAQRFRDFGRASTKTSLSSLVARREEQVLLLRAMVQLPSDIALTMQLYYWENMHSTQIGEVLDLSPSTVTTRLSRGRERLRELIVELADSPEVRGGLLADLDSWTRSLTGDDPGPPASCGVAG